MKSQEVQCVATYLLSVMYDLIITFGKTTQITTLHSLI